MAYDDNLAPTPTVRERKNGTRTRVCWGESPRVIEVTSTNIGPGHLSRLLKAVAKYVDEADAHAIQLSTEWSEDSGTTLITAVVY